jgi:peptidoglycan/xylan/chitin deacetylase (PgdA/CDA1 family)
MTILSAWARRCAPLPTLQAVLLLAGFELFAAGAPASPAHADCPADAVGTSRVLAIEPAAFPRVGRKQFTATLPLERGEVVLTFDDGPWPGTTPNVLDALRRECVKATFFVLGRNAVAHPDILRREVAEGHTVAHHTWSHPLLNRMTVSAAEAQIDRGIAAVDGVLYGRREPQPIPRFFRFPGFASSPALLDRLARRRIVVFGADLWASDWNPMTPDAELRLVLHRLGQAGHGIVLFHDTKRQTAAMLPAFLRALKQRGFRIVHVVPANSAGKVSKGPAEP